MLRVSIFSKARPRVFPAFRPWHKHQPRGAWKPRASLHSAWPCIASRPESTHGRHSRDRGKGGFYQSHKAQRSGSMLCKTRVWQMIPCALQKSRWRTFSKCDVRILHLLRSQQVHGANEKGTVCSQNLTPRMWFWGRVQIQKARAPASTTPAGPGHCSNWKTSWRYLEEPSTSQTGRRRYTYGEPPEARTCIWDSGDSARCPSASTVLDKALASGPWPPSAAVTKRVCFTRYDP